MRDQARPLRLVDVAERAGVSIATASRSLNGAPGVSPALAEKVRAVAESLGYVVNAHARSLAGGQATSVGLIVGAIDDPYFAEIASGVISAATASGKQVQISHAGNPPELLAEVRRLLAYNVGAILLAGSGLADDSASSAAIESELTLFQQGGGRVVVLGRHAVTAPAILPDNIGGGTAIARHLLSLGHTRIAVVAGPANLTSVADRLEGILTVLGPAAVCVTHHEFSREGGAEGARIALGHGITAIAALSDIMAIGALAELRRQNIAVPMDVSVTGFDDISVAADVAPSLTTVRLGLAELGAALVAAVQTSGPLPVTATPARLVQRASTASPATQHVK
jgi:LacI family transcriptional regulator